MFLREVNKLFVIKLINDVVYEEKENFIFVVKDEKKWLYFYKFECIFFIVKIIKNK